MVFCRTFTAKAFCGFFYSGIFPKRVSWYFLRHFFFQRHSLVFFVAPLRPLVDLARCVPHQKVVEPAVLFNFMSPYSTPASSALPQPASPSCILLHFCILPPATSFKGKPCWPKEECILGASWRHFEFGSLILEPQLAFIGWAWPCAPPAPVEQ